MHLDHKIPWNTISSHFGFIKEIQYKNCKDDFVIYDRFADRQSAELKHFTKTLVSVIEEFATTERLSTYRLPLCQHLVFSSTRLSYRPSNRNTTSNHLEPTPQSPIPFVGNSRMSTIGSVKLHTARLMGT
ncbi:hypothetical protein RU639_000493 [Aspergillus parasiticus]